MRIQWNNKYLKWGFTALCVICGSIFFYYLLFHTSNIKLFVSELLDILMPITLGVVLAYLMTPVLNWFEDRMLFPICEKLKIKDNKKNRKVVRAIGILLTAIFFWLVIVTLIYTLMSQIVPSVQSIVNNSDKYAQDVTTWITKTLSDNPQIEEMAIDLFNRYSGKLENFLNNNVLAKSSELIMSLSMSVLNLLGILWDFILGFLISIYLMASKEMFATQAKKIAFAMFERETANLTINNFRFTHNTFIGFIGGKLLDSLIIGILCLIGTSILKTPYAVLVSVIIGVTNIIPFFGPFLGAIPCSILILVVDITHPLNCIYFVIFILLLQQVDGNIIGPKILGSSTGLKSFWVIFAITLFGGMFGILGMIVGVPLFAVIYAAIRSIVNSALSKRNMPTETSLYADIEFVGEEGFRKYDETLRKKVKKKQALTEEEKSTLPRSGKAFVSNNEQWKRLYHIDKKITTEESDK